MIRRLLPWLVLGCAGCGSCGSKSAGGTEAAASASAAASTLAASPAVPESLPRCRREAAHVALPGEGVVVGDVAVGPKGLLVGLLHDDRGKHLAAVLRASLDLQTSRIVDVGPAFGDDPPPTPKWTGDAAWVGYLERVTPDGGSKLRALRLAHLEEEAVGKVEATVLQQADESTASDIAWSEDGTAVAAWDEDAPWGSDGGGADDARGFVKVQALLPEKRAPRVASPETSDAELPQLLARPKASGGGFWLAWLARRAEAEEHVVEGPGEPRAFRWVEVTTLDARGEPVGPGSGLVRRVSPEKGRAVGFELANSGSDLVVMVEDEAAPSEGAGARILRYLVRAKPDGIESTGIVDGGVGHGLAELVAAPVTGARWLAWTDNGEHAHLTALASNLTANAPTTLEPSLDGARVIAAWPGGASGSERGLTDASGSERGLTDASGSERGLADALYAAVPAHLANPADPANSAKPAGDGAGSSTSELRRFTCR